MRAGFPGQLRQSGAVALDAVEMPLDGRVLESREINPVALFVDADHRASQPRDNSARGGKRPISLCDLVDQSAVHPVAIEMHVAVALRGPEEMLSVLHEIEVIAGVDPAGISFTQHATRSAGFGVGEVEAHLRLRTVQHFEAHVRRVGQPFHPQYPFVRLVGDFHPAGVQVADTDNANADMRIALASFRINLVDDVRVDGSEVDEGADRHTGLVGLEVGNRSRVGRPPVGGVLASENFLPVHPRERSVEGGLRTVAGEPDLLLIGDVVCVKIVLSHVGEEARVRRELRVLLFRRSVGDAGELGRTQVEEEDVSVKFVSGEISCSIESARPRQHFLYVGNRLERRERFDRLGHVQHRVPTPG